MAFRSFKAYLSKEDGTSAKPEVRRFEIDQEIVSNFQCLRERLQTVFPSIRGKRFTISWKDTDDDNILISSDEELKIALAETLGSVPRLLYLTLCSDYEQQETKASTAETGVRHPHVICDACDKGIFGFRYKCIQCSDYDLCMECEAQSLHPEHCMLRIPVPMQWKTHYTRRLARHMNRVSKAQSFSGPSENSKQGPCKSTRCEPRSRHFAENPSWIDLVAAYVKDWTDASTGGCPMKETQQSEQSQVPSQTEPKTAEASKERESKTHSRKNSDSHVEFLKNIGEHIAQFLDPLGIDVNVQVKNEKAQNTTPLGHTSVFARSSAAADSAFKPVSTPNVNDQEKKDKAQNTVFASSFTATDSALKSAMAAASAPNTTEPIVTKASFNTNIQEEKFPQKARVIEAKDHVSSNASVDMNSSNETVVMEKSNPETEGWTLLNENDSPSSSSHSSPIASRATSVVAEVPLPDLPSAPSANASGTQPQKPLYPPLPQEGRFYTVARGEEISKPQYHSNPKIQRAIETMMEMGFSNEGGWLTQLLVTKDGDISKALDILAPIRR